MLRFNENDEIAPMISGGFGMNKVILFETEEKAKKAVIESELVADDEFEIFEWPKAVENPCVECGKEWNTSETDECTHCGNVIPF